jgi:chromosomal replication initiator protein
MQPYGPPQAREARMLVCYLAREITQETYPRIGSLLGYADHTTALYGHKRITKLLAKNPTSAAVVAKLRASLTPGGVYGDAAIF